MRAALLLLLAAGCNQLLGIGDLTVASDGGSDAPDATPYVPPPRSATIAVFDAHIVDPEANAPPYNGYNGAFIQLGFADTSGGNGEVLAGSSPIGGCLLLQYDSAHPAPPAMDGGTISIAGAGLRKTVGPCTDDFNLGTGFMYECVSTPTTSGTVTATVTSASIVDVTLPTGTLTGQSVVDGWLELQGLSDSHFDSIFPIIGQNGDTLTLYDAPAATGESANGTAQYQIAMGFSPVPIATAAATDFLGSDPSQTVEISKDASQNGSWGAFDVTLAPEGDGFHLATSGASPANLPQAGAGTDAVFGCDDASTGGNCGVASRAPLTGTMILATSTDQDVSSLPPYSMPGPVSSETRKKLECVYFGSHTATIPHALLDKLWADGTTRIQTIVARVSAAEITDLATGSTADVVVGDALVGNTDPS